MTLISRNKFLSIFCITILIFILLIFSSFLINLFMGKIDAFPNPIISNSLTVKTFIFSSISLFSIIAISFLGLYPLICGLLIKYSFGKTQASEIMYFVGFLFGCLLELLRLFIPILNLWNSFSLFVIVIGKIVFAGRLITIFSFLLASIFPREVQGHEPERYLIFLTLFSLFFAVFVPVKAGEILDSISPQTGFSSTFSAINISIFIITCISMFFTDRKENIFPYILLILGYTFLVYANNFCLLVFGILFLSFGTFHYLVKIHNYYLWR